MEKQPFKKISYAYRFPFYFLLACILAGVFMYNAEPSSVVIAPPLLKCPYDEPKVSPVSENRIRLGPILKDVTSNLVILPSAPQPNRPESDTALMKWRQTSNIMYVLGEYYIGKSLVIVDPKCETICITIVLPVQSAREIAFEGQVPDVEALKAQYKVQSVIFMDALPKLLAGQTVLSTSKDALDPVPKAIQDQLASAKVEIKFDVNVEQAFIRSRFIKTKPEIELMKFSSKIAAYSHKWAERRIKFDPDVTESTLAAFFEYTSALCYNRLQGYNPIVGAGGHSAVLHYPTGETQDSGYNHIGKKDLILIDAAGAYKGYASDLTRTYARKDSKKRDALVSIVLHAQKAGISAYKEGNLLSQVTDLTILHLLAGLVKYDFFTTDNLDTLVASGVVSIFMPHGISHPIGLDVHDPVPTIWTAKEQAFTGLRNEYPLKAKFDYQLTKGQLHTVEPGIYFIPYLLDQARNNATKAVNDLINWETVDKYKDIGGVRIEDVVGIDYEGNTIVITEL
ncbi:hypothetical protein HDV06_003182 [Boothiomyces sp. JEL0866]|nr:hypothetical protein HDV06_003182 [Boothiomyces sp. JEL0866]